MDQFFIEIENENDESQAHYVYRAQAMKVIGGAGSTSDSTMSNTLVVDHTHLRDYDVELAETLDGEYVRFELFLMGVH